MPQIPEMNKALIIFEGNYALEQNLPTDVVSWDVLGLNQTCPGCTVNRFAAQGYLECKQATNNWQAIVGAYAGQGLVFSIAGHGLGGMHSLIASADLNHQNIAVRHVILSRPLIAAVLLAQLRRASHVQPARRCVLSPPS